LFLSNLPLLRVSTPGGHALGWLAAFGVWMGAGKLLAAAGGQAAPGSWEIWAINAALFAVLAFPGIVWRYLMRP
jgi:hypothetical protein